MPLPGSSAVSGKAGSEEEVGWGAPGLCDSAVEHPPVHQEAMFIPGRVWAPAPAGGVREILSH